MKKKLILMCIAGVFAMTGMIGGTLAGFHTSTERRGVADITVKALGIDLLGTGNPDANFEEVSVKKGAPGEEISLQQCVRNNVEDGYTLYTRVTIDKKWDEAELDASKIHLYVWNGEEKEELAAGSIVNDWIVWYSDPEQIVMYYTKPLSAGTESTDFINMVSLEADMDNAYAKATAYLTFRADAIQEIAAADAIPAEWGVYPQLDKDGIIFNIEE